MREIKFRAWCKLDKILYDWERVKTEFTFEYLDDRGLVFQQYTGLHDKTHLNEIVLGDLVIVDSPRGSFKAKIIQEVGAFGIEAIDGQIIDYFADNWNDDFMTLLDIYWNFDNDDNVIEEIEIIGNIFENPELLETKKSS